jgi:hypothetical protein
MSARGILTPTSPPSAASAASAASVASLAAPPPEVDLGTVYPFSDARFFRVMLDLLDVFNCMYLGFYLEHFSYR